MRKAGIIVLMFFLSFPVFSQGWQVELMGGAASYNGDLTERSLSIKRLGPSAAFNIRYVSDDYWCIRAGVAYGMISGDDQKNKDAGLRSRNLNFKSQVIEFNICAELSLVDPTLYYSYPYVFAGAGVFLYNPFTYDKDNKKTFLRPLSTEGQGLAAYPDRKMYSLTQFCVPFGIGWKFNLNSRIQVGYEFGYRLLFTDYLDDVSKRYVSLSALEAAKGAVAAELSYRKKEPFTEEGEVRGNSKVNDMYFFTGFKIATWLGKRTKERMIENF